LAAFGGLRASLLLICGSPDEISQNVPWQEEYCTVQDSTMQYSHSPVRCSRVVLSQSEAFVDESLSPAIGFWLE
jgi:hypothetical protein